MCRVPFVASKIHRFSPSSSTYSTVHENNEPSPTLTMIGPRLGTRRVSSLWLSPLSPAGHGIVSVIDLAGRELLAEDLDAGSSVAIRLQHEECPPCSAVEWLKATVLAFANLISHALAAVDRVVMHSPLAAVGVGEGQGMTVINADPVTVRSKSAVAIRRVLPGFRGVTRTLSPKSVNPATVGSDIDQAMLCSPVDEVSQTTCPANETDSFNRRVA